MQPGPAQHQTVAAFLTLPSPPCPPLPPPPHPPVSPAPADAERTPVWLMRQAGRYMAAFREYSDRLPFRERSETASIAIELSMQPWRAFQTDGVIMFRWAAGAEGQGVSRGPVQGRRRRAP